MIEKFLLLCILCVPGLQGSKVEYTYSDQALGWIKYYPTPATWIDAKIRCDSDGAVLASPLVADLRDAIKQLVLKQNPADSAIYTGVQAEFQNGDFFSIERVPISNLPVPLEAGPPTVYNNQQSCVVWDVVNTKLKKVGCDTTQPSVCYKKRTGSSLPEVETVTPLTPPEINQDVQPEQPYQPAQTDQWSQGNQGTPTNPLPYQGSQSNQWHQTNKVPNQWSQTNSPAQTNQGLPTNQWSQPNPGSPTNQRSPNSHQQTNQGSPTHHPPQTNQGLPKNQPFPNNQRSQALPTPQTPIKRRPKKCTADAKTLIIMNSAVELAALQYFTKYDLPVTIIFADRAYTQALNKSGWQLTVQNPYKVVSSHTSYNNETLSNEGARPSHETIQTGYPSVNRRTSAAQEAMKNQPDRTVPPKYAPQNYGQYSQSTNNMQTQIPSDPAYRRPVSFYSYLYNKQADGWLKMHQPATWNEALNRCASEGAVLASPLTPNLYDAMKLYVSQFAGSATRIYTGVRANYTNGDFYSVEGVSLNNMPVTLDQGRTIDYQSSETCIVMTMQNNIVSSVKCTDLLPYVCHKKRTVVIGCDKRYEGYSYEPRTGSCYKFHTKPKSWSDAYTTCNNEKAYLAVTNSIVENNALIDLFAQYPAVKLTSYYRNNIYVGRRDWRDGRSWVTVKTQSLPDSGFIGWAPGEPNNAGGKENCGTMSRRGEMYDESCDHNLSFICEKESEVFDANPDGFGRL